MYVVSPILLTTWCNLHTIRGIDKSMVSKKKKKKEGWSNGEKIVFGCIVARLTEIKREGCKIKMSWKRKGQGNDPETF